MNFPVYLGVAAQLLCLAACGIANNDNFFDNPNKEENKPLRSWKAFNFDNFIGLNGEKTKTMEENMKRNLVNVDNLKTNIDVDSVGNLFNNKIQMLRYKRNITEDKKPTQSTLDVTLPKEIKEKLNKANIEESMETKSLSKGIFSQAFDNITIVDQTRKSGIVNKKKILIAETNESKMIDKLFGYMEDLIADVKEKALMLRKVEKHFEIDQRYTIGYIVGSLKHTFKDVLEFYNNTKKSKSSLDGLKTVDAYGELKKLENKFTATMMSLLKIMREMKDGITNKKGEFFS